METRAITAWWQGTKQRTRNFAGRLMRRLGLSLALLAVVMTGTLAQFAAVGLGVASAHAAPTQQGKNTYHPTPDRGGKAIVLPSQRDTTTATTAAVSGTRPAGVTMQPADLALSPGAEAHLVSSDKRLEVTVPAGAVTPEVLSEAGGPVHLHVVELEGPSGGSDSGRVSLGTYQFILIGPHGQVAASLAKALQLTLHLDGWRGAGFNAQNTLLIVNGGVANTFLAGPNGVVPAGLKPSYERTTLNAAAKTLTTILPFSTGGGSSTGTWNTNTPEAQWSKQTDTSVDLSSGDLTYSYPLDVPAGPGGLTPQLTLSYDSAAVTGNHNPQATSGWLGEGWDLSVGSISWTEHNVTSTCSQTCGNTWEDSWQFSDAYGNSGELIPPDSVDAPWLDDTPNSTNALTPEPLTWHLNGNEGKVRIVSYTNPNIDQNRFPNPPYTTAPPCFRAFLPNGFIEEFGCTTDSLQYYVNENLLSQYSKANYVYRWDLDMIIDPNGNQIHFSYNEITNRDKINDFVFPIDAELSSITYDSPSCHSQTLCTGTSWQPAVQVVFDTNYAPARLVGASCPTWTSSQYETAQTMRCDDVHDLSGQNPVGDAAPTLQSLVALNDVKVQVTMTPSNPTWNTLRTYQFSYEQGPSTTTYNYGSGSTTIKDPNTGLVESVAGYLDLVTIQEIGDDGTTALPSLSMQYTTVDEYYIDAMNPNAAPAPSGNCGPLFNAKGCKLWAQSYNARYLTELDNGRGWSETYQWKLARDNTHGINSDISDPLGAQDPFACTNASLTDQQTTPCSQTDDENWSRVTLTQRQASVQCVAANGSGCGPHGSDTLTSTSSYAYVLTSFANNSVHFCGDCLQGMYWGDWSDGDELDFYNAHFMGFKFVNVTNPDGSLTVYTFNATIGYGEATSTITCKAFNNTCPVSPWTSASNALHGRVAEEDDYDTDARTLLKQTLYQYNVTCPAPGVPASPSNTNSSNSYVGQNTSELDPFNPVTVCEITTKQVDTYAVDGGAALSGSHATTAYGYSYGTNGNISQETEDTTANNASAGGTPHILKRTQEVWDDAISKTSTSAGGTYLATQPAIETTEDGSGNVKACTYTGYDGGTPGATGQQGSLTKGLVTRTDAYSQSCTPGSLSGQVSTTRTYDASGNVLATQDADAVAGIAGHTDATDCTVGTVAYSACAVFDGTYEALPIQVTNALGQRTDLNYTTDGANLTSPDATNGFGQWLTLTTDANEQNTQYAYDALGRLTATAKPGDSISSPTTRYGYTVACNLTGAEEPCTSLSTTQQVSSGIAGDVTTDYDGWGRPVETIKEESSTTGGGQTTTTYSVQYTFYDPSGRTSFTSDPYFVTTSCSVCFSGFLYFRPDTTQPGTSTTYDGLGRVLTTEDPLQKTTTTSYSTEQPLSGNHITDTASYEATAVIDANSHEHITLTDGFGRTRYVEQLMGNGTQNSPYALYGTTASVYDWLGDVTSVTGPAAYPTTGVGLNASPQTTTTYDLLGRAVGMSDADLGNGWTYSYDPDGNLVQSTDPRIPPCGGAPICPNDTVVSASYDGLDRQTSRSTNIGSAYVTYTYDSTASGNDGKGRLTSETFSGGTQSDPLSGSYSYTYDGRGQVTAWTQTTTSGTPYTLQTSYNDAGQPVTLTYSDGEVMTLGYSAFDWLTSATTLPAGQGQQQVNLLTNIGYSGVGGAAMHPTSASVGNGTFTYSASYDNDLRLSSVSENLVSPSLTLFNSTRTYDAVGNVATVATTLAAGTDNQAFCYDEQNRLTWSGSTGTPPCTGTAIAAGSLTSAAYTLGYSYDAMNRIQSNTLFGGYLYGAAGTAPTHAATGAGSNGQGGPYYSASYDGVGDMTCRAPNRLTTCAVAPATGQQMSYDAERRVSHWQSAPGGSPSAAADYLYDGSGNRVEQATTSSGTSTQVYYLFGGVEEVSSTGGTSTLTKYYSAGGLLIGENVGGTISYLASDGLGSVSEALSTSGTATAAQLYGPYGGVRYSNGTMPTAKGFTGQRADAISGLDYYGARYYDPVLGQFASADTKQGPNRFAYVADDPETLTDPTGQLRTCIDPQDGCGGGGGNPPPPPPPPGNGGGGGSGNGTGGEQHLTGFLGWLQQQLQLWGIDLTALGLGTNYTKDTNASLIDYLSQVLMTLLQHHHAAKSPGRFTRRLADLDGAEALDEMLDVVGKAIIGLGFVADMAGEMISFFYGNSRPDLQGTARLYAAFFAGFVHATISTAFAVGGVAIVDALTDGIGAVANFFIGAVGALVGGKVADLATPDIVDMFIPGGTPHVTPIPDPTNYCDFACT